jgi:hypothetical protein
MATVQCKLALLQVGPVMLARCAYPCVGSLLGSDALLEHRGTLVTDGMCAREVAGRVHLNRGRTGIYASK